VSGVAWALASVLAVSAAAPQDGETAPEGGLAIEEFEPDAGLPTEFTSQPAAPHALTARPYGTYATSLGVDVRQDSPYDAPLGENVVDLQGRLSFGLDARLGEQARGVVEARALWRGSARRGFERAKAFWELEPGEAYLDLYWPKLDLRLGNQVAAFGANPAFSPADQLNPKDLRFSPLLTEAGDQKLPNLGVRAATTVGKVSLTGVLFPFFRPSRYSVVGQDEALLQPSLGLSPPISADPSIEDALSPHLLETERPLPVPWRGDLGIRATTDLGGWKAGLSWLWIAEKLPQVTLDPELSALAASAALGQPADPALVVSAQSRLLLGERLVQGRYGRQHVLSAEATALLGTAQLDLDLGFSPEQTFVDEGLRPVRRTSVSWVVGLSQAEDSPLTYYVAYVGLAVPGLSSEGFLLLVEPATARGAPRTVWFHALFATASYRFWSERLEASLRVGLEPIQRSYALAPSLAYRASDALVLALGAEVYQGPAFSPFGYFDRNDQLRLELRGAL
jgi:hypothetical protein